MRTREDIEKEFDIDGAGFITSPGRYEAEPLYTPYFHDIVLEGGGDDQFDDNGTLVTFVDVKEKDIETFPELDGIHRVSVWESDVGFVYCRAEEKAPVNPNEDDYE